jgi:D-alanyl-D-alanine carboxypeptidase/D-alanyl-D-alanine-endopeptidase (penicillin-binding protein 4)
VRVVSRAAWLLVVGALVCWSIHSPAAYSQGSGSAEGSADPGEDDDTAGSGSGSGSMLVAPALPAAKKQWVTERLQASIAARPLLARARIGVAVTDLVTGEEVFAANPDMKLNLASNTKLLTSVAALGVLGNGFRWRTGVFAEQPVDDAGVIAGDLYLRGKGDPMLSVANLDALAAEIAARGVRTIEGRLVLDTGYFDGVVEPPHFSEQPKERAGFRAPVASLGVARSAFTVIVVADPGGGATVTLEPDTGGYYTITKREVTSVTEGRTRLRVETKTKRDHIEIEVTGTIRTGEGSWDFRRRVDDPARFAAEVFKRALADHGVTFKQRSIGTGPVPLTAKAIAVHDSQPLADVLRYMNKTSDNYVAESVLKTLGAETRATPGPATWADGLAAVRNHLATIGLPAGSFRAENGSGLFASSDVSAHQMVTLLTAAHKDYRIGPDLVASLPIGGVDGTLAKRWHGHPARGRVRAKTGTLDKVVTIAGYLAADSGHPLAFAILLNDIPAGQRGLARALMDEMVDVLAAYLGAS